jgi:hypothetical protein
MGVSMGAFAAPNRASVMNSLPAPHRGAGAGMNQTFINSAHVLSIGIFFTLVMIAWRNPPYFPIDAENKGALCQKQ